MDRSCRGAGGADGGRSCWRRADSGIVDQFVGELGTRAQTKTLTIGVLMPFSGDGALWGKTELASIQVACEQLNAAGGIKAGNDTYMLATKAYDHQWDPAVSATVARKAVSDGIRYIVSWSGPRGPGRERGRAGQHRPHVRHRARHHLPGHQAPGQLHELVLLPGQHPGPLQVRARQRYPDTRRSPRSSPTTPRACRRPRTSARSIPPIGFEVLDPVTITGKETDYYPVLTPLLKKGVDIIDVGSPGPEDVGLIIKQARELGYKGTFAMADAPNITEYADIAGWPAVEGFLGSPEYAKLTTAQGHDWQKAFKAKTKGDTATSPTFDYDSILLLAAAMQKAGTARPGGREGHPADREGRGRQGPGQVRRRDVARHPAPHGVPINVVEVKNGKVVNVYNGGPTGEPQ